MAVDLQREGDVGMTEPLAHDSRVDRAGCEQQRCVRVPEAVQRDVGDGQCLQELRERLADVVWVMRGSERRSEDVAVFFPTPDEFLSSFWALR